MDCAVVSIRHLIYKAHLPFFLSFFLSFSLSLSLSLFQELKRILSVYGTVHLFWAALVLSLIIYEIAAAGCVADSS